MAKDYENHTECRCEHPNFHRVIGGSGGLSVVTQCSECECRVVYKSPK